MEVVGDTTEVVVEAVKVIHIVGGFIAFQVSLLTNYFCLEVCTASIVESFKNVICDGLILCCQILLVNIDFVKTFFLVSYGFISYYSPWMVV